MQRTRTQLEYIKRRFTARLPEKTDAEDVEPDPSLLSIYLPLHHHKYHIT